MAFFTRGEDPPGFRNYRSYRPYLRRDFRQQCAYCERSEAYIGDADFFGVDHFRPRSVFPHLEAVYSNLYYACNRCNRNKRDTWPSREGFEAGKRFADPCESDPYAEHVREAEDGSLEPLTVAGEYTIFHLRLNDPPYRLFRTKRTRMAEEIAALKSRLDDCSSRPEVDRATVARLREVLDLLEGEYVECYRR